MYRDFFVSWFTIYDNAMTLRLISMTYLPYVLTKGWTKLYWPKLWWSIGEILAKQSDWCYELINLISIRLKKKNKKTIVLYKSYSVSVDVSMQLFVPSLGFVYRYILISPRLLHTIPIWINSYASPDSRFHELLRIDESDIHIECKDVTWRR